MAKFELPIHDTKTGEVVKTYQRNFMPVDLYLRFQKLSEKVIENGIKNDEEMFSALKPLFLETFSELTSDEYRKGVDVGEALAVWQSVIDKSAQIESGNSKNG